MPTRLTMLFFPRSAPDAPTPLVPADTVAGRSLVIVVAIMTFLAALCAGAAILVADASAEWRGEAAREATIQLQAGKERDIEADLQTAAAIAEKTPGVRGVRIYTRAESEALLTPWLGEGLDLSDLPTPRMIVVQLDSTGPASLDRLRLDLIAALPDATLDDHHLTIARLGDMARVVVVIAIAIFLLAVIALGVVVASATRAAVAANREIVDILHIVGADDTLITGEFRRRFLSLGWRGAAIGGGCAIGFFALAQLLSSQSRAGAGADQMQAMFGDFVLGLAGYGLILALVAGVAWLTAMLCQKTVFQYLKDIKS
jgi:cell division transport system permease protein